ncbi:hypothetical protein Taro_000203 [Colocasia esculenta]|uniref:Auxin efflux carrier component n=2 Tax=Magnoliopsida TaxID=3398 RepID=A0A843TBH7_COLES|nr:hypothetical protein [Colocasia esculenta]
MITWKDFYTVMAAVVPLYVAMILAYGSVRWWRIFSPDQCSGINRFVAVFAVPLLSFHFISNNNPYAMNFRFIAADTLQKIIVLSALTLWSKISSRSSSGGGALDWAITIFSLSTLPNTLVMGIPLLIAMYNEYAGALMVQVVVLQCIIWYTLLLFLFEYRAARLLILEQFPDGTAASIVSFKVDSDVVSLVDGAGDDGHSGHQFLQADAEVGDDGKIHVTVRKSTSSRRSVSMMTPRPSNLTGAEIYSLSSSRNPTPRGSNFNMSDFYAATRPSNFGLADLYGLQSSRGPTPRPSNFDESHGNAIGSPRIGHHQVAAPPPASVAYPVPNPEIAAGCSAAGTKSNNKLQPPHQLQGVATGGKHRNNQHNHHDTKELHMFVWSSSASPVSEVGGLHVFGSGEFAATEHAAGRNDLGAKEIRMIVPADAPANRPSRTEGENALGVDNLSFAGGDEEEGKERASDGLYKLGSSSTAELHPQDGGFVPGKLMSNGKSEKQQQLPPASVMTRLILIMVWRKLIRNPNTYSSLIGVIWSLVSFRWNVDMPKIVAKSISILSDAGLGMAMFSLGLFMALQPRIIACGNTVASFAMAIRFLTGPAVMAAASIAVGLRGMLLHVAIVQVSKRARLQALPPHLAPSLAPRRRDTSPLDSGLYLLAACSNQPRQRERTCRWPWPADEGHPAIILGCRSPTVGLTLEYSLRRAILFALAAGRDRQQAQPIRITFSCLIMRTAVVVAGIDGGVNGEGSLLAKHNVAINLLRSLIITSSSLSISDPVILAYQAALPQGIVPFVFAKEYNVHPAILSTAVIFGMLIALPITLVYYILLGL